MRRTRCLKGSARLSRRRAARLWADALSGDVSRNAGTIGPTLTRSRAKRRPRPHSRELGRRAPALDERRFSARPTSSDPCPRRRLGETAFNVPSGFASSEAPSPARAGLSPGCPLLPRTAAPGATQAWRYRRLSARHWAFAFDLSGALRADNRRRLRSAEQLWGDEGHTRLSSFVWPNRTPRQNRAPRSRGNNAATGPPARNGAHVPSGCPSRSAMTHSAAGLKPSPTWAPRTSTFSLRGPSACRHARQATTPSVRL